MPTEITDYVRETYPTPETLNSIDAAIDAARRIGSAVRSGVFTRGMDAPEIEGLARPTGLTCGSVTFPDLGTSPATESVVGRATEHPQPDVFALLSEPDETDHPHFHGTSAERPQLGVCRDWSEDEIAARQRIFDSERDRQRARQRASEERMRGTSRPELYASEDSWYHYQPAASTPDVNTLQLRIAELEGQLRAVSDAYNVQFELNHTPQNYDGN